MNIIHTTKSIIATTALSLLFLSMQCPATEVTKVKQHGSWLSLLACEPSFCIARAAVSSSESGDVLFIANYTKGSIVPSFQMVTQGMSKKTLSEWDEDSDQTTVKLRVDKNPIRQLKITRELVREERSLSWDFSALSFDFEEELKNGQTLRIRTFNGTRTIDLSFQLNGFTSANDRAKLLARELARDYKSDADEYFGPSSQYF